MVEGRYAPVAATLPNGDVLVAGGYVEELKPLKTAELFVPASGTFQKLLGEMVEPRGEQAYAGLPSGKVLIAGGFNYLTSKTGNPLKTAEFFDPETNSFSKLSGEMTAARDGPAAAPLPSGKVLVVGGALELGKPLKTAELFNPATNTFEAIGAEMAVGRYFPAAVTLPNGKVLIAGGYGGSGVATLKTAELFNPATNTFEALSGSTHEMTETREELPGVLLQDGRALLIGGLSKGKALAGTELFNPETNTFEGPSGELTEQREGSASANLADGRVLVVGGYNPTLEPHASRYLKTAELTSVTAPAATTGSASSVGMTTVTLTGSVLTEAIGTVYFQYGPNTAYGASTVHQPVGGSTSTRSIATNLSGLSPGTIYHFRVVAENAGGPSFGADQTFTTGSVPPIMTGCSCATALRPVVSGLHQSHSTWREGSKLAQLSRTRAPVGTMLSFSLNESARVTFLFSQQVAGRKVNGRCLAQTRANSHRHACKRTLNAGTLPFTGHLGPNKVSFQGRVASSKKLQPGTYTLTVTATDAGGRHSSPKQLSFTIVK
jgi:hypothetical protein